MSLPDVTVISPFYNRGHLIASSVGSVLNQTYDKYRVVVIDDGSSDDTARQLAAFRDQKLEVIHQTNRGFTQTMAQECERATTPFIAVHGAGDDSLPDRIALQRQLLIENPNIVAVGCGVEHVRSDGVRTVHIPSSPRKVGPLLSGFEISHGELMFRRDAYLAIGGYRLLFSVGQATDLFKRLSKIGDFGYVQRVLYRRYMLDDGVSASPVKLANRELFASISATSHERSLGSRGIVTLRDDIDKFGMLYPYLAKPSKNTAAALARAALMYWVSGDLDTARRLAWRSLAESPTRLGMKLYLATRLPRSIGSNRLLRHIIDSDKGTGENSLGCLIERFPSFLNR